MERIKSFKQLNENVIKLTKNEFKRLHNLSVDHPPDIKFMKDKGISFDSGVIDIEIDGREEKMETSKFDFGTLVAKRFK